MTGEQERMEPLSEEQRRNVSALAAGVHERLAASLVERTRAAAEPTPAARRAVETWKTAVAGGNETAFRRRLSWDGMDESQVLLALSQPPPASAPAPWTWWVEQFVVQSGMQAAQVASGETPVELALFEPSMPPPFFELWIPILRVARAELVRRQPALSLDIAPAALACLERQLIKEIAFISELTMYDAFVASREAEGGDGGSAPGDRAYRRFADRMLRGGIADFFSTYPVLARDVARLAATWCDSMAEFFSRLQRDRAALGRAFLPGRALGMVSDVETGLSDRHGGGRRVIAVGFESGWRLVYKPREVGVEAAFHQFLAWAASRGLRPAPAALRVVAGDGCGWFEYAEQGSFESEHEVREYYRRSGSLLCVAFVLGARDLHMENVIASARGPIVADAEMMLQPGSMPADLAEVVSAREADSCLSTGFLSLLETDPLGATHDIGALRGRGGSLAPVTKRVWTGLRTDAVRFVEEEARAPAARNQVFLGGIEQRPEDFAEELVEGFAGAYRFLERHRAEILAPAGPLAALEQQHVRVLLRPTKQYAVLLHTLAAPRYQRDGLLRSFMIEALCRVHIQETIRPRLWPLVADERSALEGLDIPRFTIAASQVSMAAASGEQVDAYSVSGVRAMRERLAHLDELDLERQVTWIRRTLSNSVDSRLAVLPPQVDPAASDLSAALLECALWLGEEFFRRSHRAGDALSWEFRERESPARLGSYDLYAGAAGVALFMAALAAVTGDSQYADGARAALRPVRSILDRPDGEGLLAGEKVGAGAGSGSLVYSACLLARLLGDVSFLDFAARAGHLITEEKMWAERCPDVLGGVAGAVLAFLTLHHHTGEPWALARAVAGGRRLLADRVATPGGGAAWPSEDRRLLAGFGHGAAGIAYALSRLFIAAGDRAYLDAAAAAYRYERSVFSADHGNWPVLTRGNSGGPQIMTAWCHGAAGIGLGRTLARDVLSDEEISAEIERAVTATAQVKLGRSDHLCCGNLGRAEILFTIGQELQRVECLTAGVEISRGVIERALGRGHFAQPSSPFEYCVFDPGFFRGLAGIGYQMLRFLAPARLPSVLGFAADLPAPAPERSWRVGDER